MPNEKELGCCGYDEIEKKPQTTNPVRVLTAKAISIQKKIDGPMVTRRISYMGSSSGRYPVMNPGGPA